MHVTEAGIFNSGFRCAGFMACDIRTWIYLTTLGDCWIMSVCLSQFLCSSSSLVRDSTLNCKIKTNRLEFLFSDSIFGIIQFNAK